MPSSTSNFDFQRVIPDLPWRGLLLGAVAVTAVATVGWEIRARAAGYRPALNDTADIWADRRETVKSDSIVIIGDSRALFDNDLTALEQGLGSRPVQLALVGSCAYPVLENLANDESFHGTVVASLIPLMWLAPPPSPPYQNSVKAIKRYQERTVAHRASSRLAMFLEEHLAFLKQDDLTSAALIKKVSVPNRAVYHAPPVLPPYFATMTRERETKMWDAAARPGPLQDRIKNGWLPLFGIPPPPDFIPQADWDKGLNEFVEARFKDTVKVVQKIQARGGKVVFVRFPVVGPLKARENELTPRAGPWTRIIAETGAPGIYFEDYPELAGFDCPEWSHLSGPDAAEFSKRLVPHLKTALAR